MFFNPILDYIIGYTAIISTIVLIVLIIRDRHSYKWWQYIASLLCSIAFVAISIGIVLAVRSNYPLTNYTAEELVRRIFWFTIYFLCCQILLSYITGKYILRNTFKKLFYKVHTIVTLYVAFSPVMTKVVRQIIGYFSQ
ncbi:hypothetical protein SAMN02745728_01484 [Desulfovibrio litoralis DSM 11393]|uniref:Uncharacterized protein n=1 Tax=Desulfovibrio litoralis DSM 11393 TaxID=1121455 RepID=A0A1M7T305_9BACT|nr:hypothetical protein SAMN02745728_01484 [Desulfovibrio litoralis DSM 11393]